MMSMWLEAPARDMQRAVDHQRRHMEKPAAVAGSLVLQAAASLGGWQPWFVVSKNPRRGSYESLLRCYHLRGRRAIVLGGSESLLALGPDLYQILEYLQLLHYRGLGLQVQVVTGVQHQHRCEADGQVVRVHLVPRGLGGDGGQVVQQVDKAVLKQK